MRRVQLLLARHCSGGDQSCYRHFHSGLQTPLYSQSRSHYYFCTTVPRSYSSNFAFYGLFLQGDTTRSIIPGAKQRSFIATDGRSKRGVNWRMNLLKMKETSVKKETNLTYNLLNKINVFFFPSFFSIVSPLLTAIAHANTNTSIFSTLFGVR